MKLLNKQKIRFLLMSSILLSLCLINTPVFSLEKTTQIKTLDDIREGTISAFAQQTKNINPERISSFNVVSKNDGLISLESDIKFFPENLTIDITLRDVDVASVLRIIAREGKKNIVIDRSVIGNINAELKKTSLNQALQVILTSQELEARLSNDTVFIASRPAMARKGLNRRCIKTFKLNNSNPVQVAQLLEASIFNKGYKVQENASGAALAEVAATGGQNSQVQSTTGQSSLIDSKTLKGKVEELVTGENFGDSSKLASTIKIQQVNSSSQPIQISNNDGGAIAIPDTRTNSVLVAGLAEDILMAEAAIKDLDKALKQVSIEVSLIELKKDNENNLGLNLNSQSGALAGGFNSVGGLTGYDFSSEANQTGIVFNTMNNLSKKNFAAQINALITDKKAKLIANPHILALDDSESLIKITDQVVSKVTTTITQTSITYNADIADVGIVLNILPKIGDDGYVTMRVRPSITNPLPEISIGDFQSGGVAAAAIKVTPISTREVILQDVRVKSGETLRIAGLTKEANVEKIGKIPLIGDLPGIGKLFQNKTYTHSKTELLILITPTIVDETANAQL